MKLIYFFVAISTFILAGCSTTPTPLSEATLTPGARIYAYSTKEATTGTLIFVRDSGIFGSALDHHVSINGKKTASMAPGEKTTIYLPAGEYVISVIPTDLFGTVAEFAIDQKIETGRTYNYRILTEGSSGSTRIHRILGDVR